jgi:hypothetical protein
MTLQVRASLGAPFSIGRVFKDSFRVLGRHLVAFMPLAAITDLPWALGYRPNPAESFVGAEQVAWSRLLIDPFLSVALSALLQLAVLFAALRTLRGERAKPADFVRGIRFIPAVVTASVILGLPGFASQLMQAMIPPNGTIGGIVMMVSGLATMILVIVLWVVTPSIAAEGRSLREGLARSVQLTRGRRWKLFVLLASVGILMTVGLAVIAVAFNVPFAMLAMLDLTTVPGALYFALAVVASAYSAVLVAVSYYHLRIEKDGVDTDQVAQVFD